MISMCNLLLFMIIDGGNEKSMFYYYESYVHFDQSAKRNQNNLEK